MLMLVAFYFWILPFQWALSPAEGIDLALSRVLAACIVIAWIAIGLARRRLTIDFSPQAFFLASFLFIVTMSSLWAENSGWAARKIVFLWTFLPLFAAFSSVLREDGAREKILKALVWGAALAGSIGIGQFFLQFPLGIGKTFVLWTVQILPFFLGEAFGGSVAAYPSLLVNISGATVMRASAFFPDPHMFSLYAGMVFPLALAFFLRDREKRRSPYFIPVLVLFLADLLSFSRGGYLALGAGLAVFAGSLLPPSIRNTRRTAAAIALFAAVSAGIFFSPFGARLLSSFSLQDGSNSERLRLWQETAGHIVQRPLLGTGIGNYPLLVKPSASYREPIYAHNLFLDIAVETGIIGLFFFLGFLSVSFWKAWQAWRRSQDIFALALLASLVIFSAHALFETPIFSVQVLPVFLLVAAVAGVL